MKGYKHRMMQEVAVGRQVMIAYMATTNRLFPSLRQYCCGK
jgi:hypothetical protein